MNLFNPMFWVGVYAQTVLMLCTGGTQGEVTADDLGHIGGNPHFRAPAYDPVVASLQGIAPRRQP